MDRIVDRLLPPGSMARLEHSLPDHLRDMLATHRRRSGTIISRHENREPGSWYSAFLAGDPDAQTPAMPKALRVALGLDDPPRVTPDMSAGKAGAIYSAMIGDQ